MFSGFYLINTSYHQHQVNRKTVTPNKIDTISSPLLRHLEFFLDPVSVYIIYIYDIFISVSMYECSVV